MAFVLIFLLCLSCRESGNKVQVIYAPEGVLSLVFTGDLSFGENYQEKIERRGGKNILKTKGYSYSIKNFVPLLLQSDLVIANLETSVTDIKQSPFEGKKSYIHRSDIYKTPAALKEYNINVVSLANNHSLDYGLKGLKQSVNALEKQDIKYVGAGFDKKSAIQPLHFDFRVDDHPIRLVIAAGFEYNKTYYKYYNYYADGIKGGTNLWNLTCAFKQIKALRQANEDAFIVAYPHFGKNYEWKNKEQTELAHALVDGGANLIIGHGAHMLQEIEYYKGQWIIYNLGNFVFNSPGRYQRNGAEPFSFVARLYIDGKEKNINYSLRLYPIFSDNKITNYQPHFVTDEQFIRVKDLLLEKSIKGRFLKNEIGSGKDEFGRYLLIDIAI